MRFIASLVAAAAALAPLAFAQDVAINPVELAQCVDSTITFTGWTGPYYIAVLPASDPCAEDALAEFYDVYDTWQTFQPELPEGTQVQIYILDNNGNEYWSQIETVGAGNETCMPGYTPVIEETTSTETTSTSSSEYEEPTPWVAPYSAAPTTTSRTYANTRSSSFSSSINDTPVNAIQGLNGAVSTSAGAASIILGAVVAAVALL